MLLNSCSKGRLDGNCGGGELQKYRLRTGSKPDYSLQKENYRKYLGLIDGDSVSFESATISSRGVILLKDILKDDEILKDGKFAIF